MNQIPTQTISVELHETLIFNPANGDISGEIPWNAMHLIREHCIELSEQQAAGEVMRWLAAVPEIMEITVLVEIEHEYDDQGGTYPVTTTLFTPKLSRPLNREITVGGMTIDASDVGESEDTLADLIRDYFSDIPNAEGFEALTNELRSNTICFNRSQLADLLGFRTYSLNDVIDRLKFKK